MVLLTEKYKQSLFISSFKMKHLKKIIAGLIILEILNLIIGGISNGKEVLLPYTGFNDPPIYYDMDSLYGVTRQKNTKQMIYYPWGGVVNEINSHGFRDDEFTKGGTLVIGNSFVEGYGVSNENRFSEKLEKELKSPVNNAGSGGVWTPVQGIVLLEHLLNIEALDFDKIVFVMTPGEVVNIGKRNPENDPGRNFPYKEGDSIKFYKSKNNSFGAYLSFPSKVKRLCKSLLMFKIYNMFKYYGAAKVKSKKLDFEKEKLDWVIKKIEEQGFDKVIDIVVINNIGRTRLNGILEYKNNSRAVRFHVLEFPDDLSNYFISNGHLNEKGNTVLAQLLMPILKKYINTTSK